MTLCLPSHILDSLFGCTKRQQSPPSSHLLVQVNLLQGGTSSWHPLPFAAAVQIASRDWRNNDDTQPNPVENSLLDCSVFLADVNRGDPSSSGNVVLHLQRLVDEALASSGEKAVALPPSTCLGAALLQSFVDLPVGVDALVKVNSSYSSSLQLEQCRFIKSGADGEFSVVAQSSGFIPARLRFALPTFALQQPKISSPHLATITLRRRRKSFDTADEHLPDMGRILLTESILNSLCVASGGQGCVFVVSGTGESEQEQPHVFDLTQAAPSSVGIIGPETKIVVNTSSSGYVPPSSSQKKKHHVDASSSVTSHLDYSGELSRLENLFLRCHSTSSLPRGLLVTGHRGMGKSHFVRTLAERVFPAESVRRKKVHFFDVAAVASESDSMVAARVLSKMKQISFLGDDGGDEASKPWLVLDPATAFFSSPFGEMDDASSASASPATRFLAMLSSSSSSSSPSSPLPALEEQVVLVCVVPHSKSHLVPDPFRRRIFSGRCCSVDLQLPSESQRVSLLSHFLQLHGPDVAAVAQRTAGGYSVSDLKKFCRAVQEEAASPSSLHHLLETTPLPRPQLELEERSSSKSNKEKLAAKIDATSHKKTSWSDIAGLDSVKKSIHRAILWPIQNPQRARLFGMERLSGVMLHGPPGNAKTTIARAICCEGGFSAFFHLDCATVLSAFVGEAERFIRDTFAQARAQAPSVIFFDEIESFGSKRKKAGGGGGGADIGVRLLATLLTEMDGVGGGGGGGQDDDDDDGSASSFGVCVIGATNLLHLVDDALLRPGRFDLLLEVPLPGPTDRELIFQHCLDTSNKCGSGMKVTADISRLAAMSRDFSGAEITGVWRDGVVSAVIAEGKKGSLLLGDDEDEDDNEVLVAEMDVTNSVAACIRGLAKKK